MKTLNAGHSVSVILKYFYPELITTSLLYGLIYIDNYFISQLSITSGYAALGYANMLFHFITKVAEGFSVGMVILCGYYNSNSEDKNVGRAVSDAFWATSFIGAAVALILYFGAYPIYNNFQLPKDMIDLGVPFLKLRSIAVFFNFIYFALLGFFRGIKNTKVPMYLFLTGAFIFVLFDYLLIFGKFGFPQMGFMGSAAASVIQYAVMLIGSFLFIATNKKKYDIKFFRFIKLENIVKLGMLSWPVMLDKACLALCHIWLGKIVGAIAATAVNQTALLSTYTALKDIERIALLPALALAQVLTFLTSNDIRSGNWESIFVTLKRVTLLSYGMVAGVLAAFFFGSRIFLGFFDKYNTFTESVIYVLPIVILLVFLDLSQLVLSAVLRGSAKVQTVMSVRWVITLLFFGPISYIISVSPIESVLLKFMLVYATFHVSGLLMSLVYMQRLQLIPLKIFKQI